MRIVALALVFLLGRMIVAGEQPSIDAKTQAQLKRLFPSATAFSPTAGDPPHFKAYITDPRSGLQKVAGFAFSTRELEPLERGYDGPIDILVGMNTAGILTGIIVGNHHEPYGNFSIDLPQFAAQFTGKSIRDAFKVGADIDAVSRASISITTATREIKNSARHVARRLLTPEIVK